MMIPRYANLSNWAASLIVDFPKDNIPVLTSEDEWKLWGNLLAEENSFSQNEVPNTSGYSDWNSWALDVFFNMNNY